jgi:hypothetical protein
MATLSATFLVLLNSLMSNKVEEPIPDNLSFN